jgi:hypothetical protein
MLPQIARGHASTRNGSNLTKGQLPPEKPIEQGKRFYGKPDLPESRSSAATVPRPIAKM